MKINVTFEPGVMDSIIALSEQATTGNYARHIVDSAAQDMAADLMRDLLSDPAWLAAQMASYWGSELFFDAAGNDGEDQEGAAE